LTLLGTAWKGIASLTGLSVAEPGFEAEAEEQWDNVGGVSGNISPSPSEVRGSASETILSFIACLRLARLFAGLFKTSIWISPSDGDKRASTALVLLCISSPSRFVSLFLTVTPIPAIAKPAELALKNPVRIILGP